jgi:hypothetical protein
LDNLHRRHQTIDPLIVQARVPSGLEALFQRVLARFLDAELACACLVEHFHEGDVEVGCVCAEGKIDGGEG